jgi:hypothetical protein
MVDAHHPRRIDGHVRQQVIEVDILLRRRADQVVTACR